MGFAPKIEQKFEIRLIRKIKDIYISRYKLFRKTNLSRLNGTNARSSSHDNCSVLQRISNTRRIHSNLDVKSAQSVLVNWTNPASEYL